MKIVVIDGQGGGIGKSLVERLKAGLPEAMVVAVGTNATATSNMMRAGAGAGATGENAVLYNCARADVIAGPIGILLANSMYGEITPMMAAAVGGSDAKKVLIPATRCHAYIVGIEERPLSRYLEEAVEVIKAYREGTA